MSMNGVCCNYDGWMHKNDFKYELCTEVYGLGRISPLLPLGCHAVDGSLIENAAELYPCAWDYLQSEEGQLLCVGEEEWQVMSQAHWHTLADGSKVGWEGTGGVPFYVLDAEAGTIRLPDLRGMYAEVAGFDGLEVAGVHGDAVREITGSAGRAIWAGDDSERYGSMWSQVTANAARVGTGATAWNTARVGMQASLAVPTANKNQPRAFGVNAFVYLGIPRV